MYWSGFAIFNALGKKLAKGTDLVKKTCRRIQNDICRLTITQATCNHWHTKTLTNLNRFIPRNSILSKPTRRYRVEALYCVSSNRLGRRNRRVAALHALAAQRRARPESSSDWRGRPRPVPARPARAAQCRARPRRVRRPGPCRDRRRPAQALAASLQDLPYI